MGAVLSPRTPGSDPLARLSTLNGERLAPDILLMPTPAAAAEARAIAGEVLNEEAQETSKVEEPAKAETPAKEPEVKPEPKPEPDEAKEEAKAERPVERTAKLMPVSKANQWRHEANNAKAKVAELEAQIAEFRSASEKAKANDLDTVAKDIAGEDASPEVVKRILEATKRVVPELPGEVKEVLALKQKLEEQAEEVAFQKDVSQVLSKFPELKGHEADLRDIAYTEGNEKVPLEYLAYKLREDLNLNVAPPSAEGKSSQAKATSEPDFASMTDEQLEQLSDADMDKYISWMNKSVAKRTGLRLKI